MNAQKELKDLFAQLDQSTDRALVGIRTIRSGDKLTEIPSETGFGLLQFGFLASLIGFFALLAAK